MPQILMPYTVHLDHTMRVTPLNTLFAKGDSAAHRFELTLIRAGVQEDLNGCKVLCKFYRMADSTVVSVPGNVEGGKAVVALSAACYDYIGRFALTIAIKNGEEETTVFYGDGYMNGQRADTAISGEYIIYDIDTLLEKIAEIDAATQAANTATENANTAASNANTARDAANTAASTANTAANNANTAKDTANAAAGKIDNMTVSATPVQTGTATAALSTVDGHYHLALGLPKGDTGATPQISVQVQTGEAGSEASVSVSGTAEDPVILLTIPRGDVGDIGNLTINGKAPDGSGAVTLTAGDLGAASAEEVSQLKNDIAPLIYNNAGAHNAVYRGKNLGTSVSAAQWAAIADGTFTDMYIGDYWTIGSVTYRIAAFDYYYHTGDSDCMTHHVTLVPDAIMYSQCMNDTDVTTGAYVGSKMYTEGLTQAKNTINAAFGSSHILNHRKYLQNAVTDGYASSASWYDSTVELMTEQNVYGCKIFGNVSNGTARPDNYTVDKSQYPLFKFRPDLISNRMSYWLRDVVSDAHFARVYYDGAADYYSAYQITGVRPAFSIIG